MRIGLYNLEPSYINIALEKLRLYHKAKGDIVSNCTPLECNAFDVVYASSIFNYTSKKYVTPDMITGGTGFNLTTTLPGDVEKMKPKINKGFTSRGCFRKCSFCVVPKKEGELRATGDLLDIWDGVNRDITLYDNNILGLPDHFQFICEQAKKHKLRLDFNQGLDHMLLNVPTVKLLKSISHKEYKFAFDDPNMTDSVIKSIKLLRDNGIRRSMWFVLTNYNTTLEEDLYRLNLLRDLDQDAYVMRYRDSNYPANGKNKSLTLLTRWANQHKLFRSLSYEQFLQIDH